MTGGFGESHLRTVISDLTERLDRSNDRAAILELLLDIKEGEPFIFPDAAVEAGAKALAGRHEMGWVFGPTSLGDQEGAESERSWFREDVEAILDAALPIILGRKEKK
jgi:hypothetical protein